jgi:hypothetical protein
MGSIRPIPVCERHGMRQKAAVLPAKASAVERIASDVFMADAVRWPAATMSTVLLFRV